MQGKGLLAEPVNVILYIVWTYLKKEVKTVNQIR